MANNQALLPSSSALVPSSSSLPSRQTPSTRTRLPVSYYPEIWNLILHFAFIPYLPPIALRKRIEEPPSLAPLLPLTLVCKGLRELALPLLYKNLAVRRAKDWTLLLHPTDGLLVGEGIEQSQRRGWVKRLSFAPNSFPSSWTPSKLLLPADEPMPPDLVMAPLDFSSLGGLEEVCVGPWGIAEAVAKENLEEILKIEIAGGRYKDDMLRGVKAEGTVLSPDLESRYESRALDILKRYIRGRFFGLQAFSLLRLFDLARPAIAHISLDALRQSYNEPIDFPFDLYIHRNPIISTVKANEVARRDDLSRAMKRFSTLLPSTKINIDFALASSTWLLAKFHVIQEERGWSRDPDSWRTWKEPLPSLPVGRRTRLGIEEAAAEPPVADHVADSPDSSPVPASPARGDEEDDGNIDAPLSPPNPPPSIPSPSHPEVEPPDENQRALVEPQPRGSQPGVEKEAKFEPKEESIDRKPKKEPKEEPVEGKIKEEARVGSVDVKVKKEAKEEPVDKKPKKEPKEESVDVKIKIKKEVKVESSTKKEESVEMGVPSAGMKKEERVDARVPKRERSVKKQKKFEPKEE